MYAFRAFLLHHRRFAALLVAAALCLKALVPAGYMVSSEARVLTVQICADTLTDQGQDVCLSPTQAPRQQCRKE